MTYYNKNGVIWKSSVIKVNSNGTLDTTKSFPVCILTDYCKGQEKTFVDMLNKAEERDILLQALKEAVDDIDEWGEYADPYYRKKWKFEETLKRYRTLIAEMSEGEGK